MLRNGNERKVRKGKKNKGKTGKESEGKERKGKERKGKERKGKERKGKERKGKERKGKERKEKSKKEMKPMDKFMGLFIPSQFYFFVHCSLKHTLTRSCSVFSFTTFQCSVELKTHANDA